MLTKEAKALSVNILVDAFFYLFSPHWNENNQNASNRVSSFIPSFNKHLLKAYPGPGTSRYWEHGNNQSKVLSSIFYSSRWRKNMNRLNKCILFQVAINTVQKNYLEYGDRVVMGYHVCAQKWKQGL